MTSEFLSLIDEVAKDTSDKVKSESGDSNLDTTKDSTEMPPSVKEAAEGVEGVSEFDKERSKLHSRIYGPDPSDRPIMFGRCGCNNACFNSTYKSFSRN